MKFCSFVRLRRKIIARNRMLRVAHFFFVYDQIIYGVHQLLIGMNRIKLLRKPIASCNKREIIH